jgi:hypothetical protein
MNRERERREQIKAEMRTWPTRTLLSFMINVGVRRVLFGKAAAKEFSRRFFPDLRFR